MSESPEPNYCHDPEILDEAKALGIKDPNKLALAKSVGEATMYGGVDRARVWLERQIEKIRENKLRQKKTKISDNAKRDILKRHGVGD